MTTIPVRYVGKKADGETDHLYGTNLVWAKPGDVQQVPEKIAPLLLNHPDVWRDARSKAAKQSDPIEPEQQPSKRLTEEEEILEPAVRLQDMQDKGQLVQYAHRVFNVTLSMDKTVPELRAEILELQRLRS